MASPAKVAPPPPIFPAMAVAEQVAFLNTILHSSTEYSIVAKDLDGMIVAWNEGARRIYGYEAVEVVGKVNAFVLHGPEDVKSGRAQAILDEARAAGKWSGELTRVRKDGSRFAAFVTITLRRDVGGNPIGFTMISRDLTDSQRALRELKESQEYNRGLIESSVDGLMMTDPLGVISDVNKQMCEMTGDSRQNLVGSPFKLCFTDPKRAADGIRKVLAEDRVTNYELVMSGRKGKETVVSINATTFRSADGKLKGVFAAARDITDQKRMEGQLRQAQSYTRGLIEASVDALLTVDLDLKITDVNEQTSRVTGHSREELIGSLFSDYFTDEKRASDGMQKALAEGFITNYVLALLSKNGKETIFSFNASVFKDTDGHIRIFAAGRDITDQKRLEDELRQAQNYTRGQIESSVDSMITVDPDLTITDVNEQMVKLTEVPKTSLIGSRFNDYFTEPARAAAAVRKTLGDGYVTNYDLTLRTPGGREMLVSFNLSVFKDTEGNVRGIFAVGRDVTAQRRLEGELREGRNYSRSLIESSVDALMTVDPAGLISDVNEQTARFTGFNRKQLIGSPFFGHFTEPERARDGIRKTFDEGVVTNYELVIRSKTGRMIPVSFNAVVFRDTTGTVAGILAAGREISRQKEIEQTLREQQSYTRSLIESNIDVLTATDTLGIITDVNLQMCALTGRTREDLVGTPFKDCFNDPRRAEDGIRKVLSEDRVTNYELTVRAKDGGETVVSLNATTFKDADGRLRGVFAAARDITEQKRLEVESRKQNRELSEATAFLNNVLESSTEYSIIAKDLDGKILAWNEGARRNYGYMAEEMVGKKSAQILYTPQDIESGRVRELFDTALQTGKAEGVFERVRKNGSRFTGAVALTLRSDSAGKPIGFVLISKDITDQKRLEEQLRRKNVELEEQNRRVQEANRLKSEFLANMSHELRTPLNGIIGFAELMHDGKVGPVSKDHKEYLGDILTSSRHLLQLINDVLDLSKIESGKMEFHPETVDLSKIVGEVRDIVRTIAAKKRVRVELDVGPEFASVLIDPAKLKQVVYNYLSNALKFTPDEGRVTVRVRPEGPGSFRLEVEDTGIGIRPEDLNRLFVEFQQLDASAAKKYQGTGLGLALTKRIVEAQGGTVGVLSTPGKGSTFFAVLPRGANIRVEGTAEPVAAPPLLARSGAPTVLVVEDDLKDRAWLVRTLGEAGYATVAAASGAEAIRLARERAFDAVTLDVLLPDVSGWDVLRAIRAEGPNRTVPAIVVTVVAERGAGVGFRIQDLLTKPIKIEDLLAALDRAGIKPSSDRLVLIVDDDPLVFKLVKPMLEEQGYQPIYAPDVQSGLREAMTRPPAVVVLDLLMPGTDGFDFLQEFRRSDVGRRTPVIVWTVKDLSAHERARLQAAAQAVVFKGEGTAERLLAEVKACIPVKVS